MAHKALKQEYTYIKKLQRNTEQRSKIFVQKNQETVDALLEPYRKAIAASDNPTFIQPPALEAPEPGPEQFIASLEQQVTNLLEDRAEPQVPEHSDKPDPEGMGDEDRAFDPSIIFNDSFSEMLDRIGINRASK